MTSLENEIKNTLINTEGGAIVRINNPNKNTIHKEIVEIQKIFKEYWNNSQKIISRPSTISLDNKAFFVNVVGLEDFKYLEKVFDLSIDSSKFEEGVLIGNKLDAK